MTETDWLATIDVPTLLRWAVPRGTRRQARLYLCGGCHAIADFFYDPASLEAVEVAERRADGTASHQDVFLAYMGAECPTFGFDWNPTHIPTDPTLRYDLIRRLKAHGALAKDFIWGDEWRIDDMARWQLSRAANIAFATVFSDDARLAIQNEYRAATLAPAEDWYWPGRWLVDCVYGNPFRPPSIAPDWRTPTVLALADGVYADRGHDRLPVLADALEETGCDDPALLAHCRGGGPHVRGCWVIDRLLDTPDEPAMAGPG